MPANAASSLTAIRAARREVASAVDDSPLRQCLVTVDLTLAPDMKLDQPPPNTLLYFFLSRHGVEIDGQDYLEAHRPGGSSPTSDPIARSTIIVTELIRR
jgi:hypothetical protein